MSTSKILYINSEHRANQAQEAGDFSVPVYMDRGVSYTSAKLCNAIVPQVWFNISEEIGNNIFYWGEDTGPGEVAKSVTFPDGLYALSAFVSMYAALVTAESDLTAVTFTISSYTYNTFLKFNKPVTVDSQVWSIKWSQMPGLAKICGFAAEDTAFVADDFISTMSYNFSPDNVLYCSISGMTPAISPGCPLQYTFPISLYSNLGTIAKEETVMTTRLDGNFSTYGTLHIKLMHSDGRTVKLMGQNWTMNIVLE
jgi:hypothetical protein